VGSSWHQQEQEEVLLLDEARTKSQTALPQAQLVLLPLC